jgi:hypothetical protein
VIFFIQCNHTQIRNWQLQAIRSVMLNSLFSTNYPLGEAAAAMLSPENGPVKVAGRIISIAVPSRP